MRDLAPRLAATVLFVVLVSAPSVASPEEVWTPARVFDAARRSSTELRQAELNFAQARLEAEAAWNQYLPEAELGSSFSRRLGGSTGDSPWSGSLSASATLTLPQAASATRRRLTVAEEAAQVELLRREAELYREVREQYFAVLLAQERLEIAEHNGELEEQRLRQVRVLFDQGRASELDLLESRSRALSRRPEVISRRETLLLEESRLRQLAGLDLADPFRLDAAVVFPAFPLEHSEVDPSAMVLEGLVNQAPEVRAARAALEQARIERRRAGWTSRGPRVSAGVSYAPSVSPPFDTRQWQEGDTWETGTLTLRIAFPLTPWIPRSEEDIRLAAVNRDRREAELMLEQVETRVRARLWELVSLLRLSEEKVAVLEEVREIAQLRYDRTVAIFESGGVELLDVENAQADLEDAELDLVQERFNTLRRVAELDALLGRGPWGEQ